MKRVIILLASLSIVALVSCVSAGKYDAMVAKKDSLQTVCDSLEKVIAQNKAEIKNLKLEVEDHKNKISSLNNELKNTKQNYEKLKSSSSKATQELMDNIENLQKSLAEKQKENLSLNSQLSELRDKLNARESAINKLKSKLQEALYGFAEKGMTVSIKDGKVYVSLSNQLLFGSGSAEIDSEGKEALLELAKVLKEQSDINILVEGHTDDKPVKSGARFEDNWDLSVLRATEVVRFLTEQGGVSPKRVIASGRSKYFPVEKGDSPQARAKNRRTEIILTPKLEQIFEIIGD